MSDVKKRGFGSSRAKPSSEGGKATNVTKRFGLDEEAILAEAVESGQIRKIDKALVSPDPAQPRKIFNQEKHEDLKASIEQHGLLQPIIVRDHPDAGQGVLIIAGERRWRAIMGMPGLKEIDVIVRNDIAPEKILMAQLIENLQREDMTPLETASAFEKAMQQQGISQKELGAQLGMSESLVSTFMSMLKAPSSIQDAASSRDIKDVTLLAKLSRLAKTNPAKADELVEKVASGEIASVEARVLTNNALKDAKGTGAPATKKPAATVTPMITRLLAKKVSWLSGSDEAVIQLETPNGVYEILFDESIEDVIAALQESAEGRAG